MPEPGLLLQSQENEVFLTIQNSGMDPRDFFWQHWESDFNSSIDVSVLTHRPSRSWFQFDMADEGHWCRFTPGNEAQREENYPGTWKLQMDYVRTWLSYVKRETQAPDLWGMLANGSTLSVAAASEQLDANTPFSAAERRRVETSLAEIRSLLLASTSVSAEALGQIDARLEYLEQASERLGRKDWLNVAFSIIANIILTAAVPPDTARNILNAAGSALSWVLGGSPLLPGTLH